MKEKALLKIALVASCIGLLLLFIFSKNIEVNEATIDKIDGMQDEEVRIQGVVERVSNKEKVTFIEITQEVTTTVVVFDNISINKGEKIEVIGKVDEYNGESEILAERIERIQNQNT
jgi:DNA/RNA endonuclease YhcR with UshA esterase domain